MMNVKLSFLDLAVMAVYLVVIVVWGLLHAKRKSARDYFLGGKGMSWQVVGLSMFATVVSSSALVGWAGDAYMTGISVFNYGISAAIVPILFFLAFFLPFYLRNQIYTLPEFLGGRFDGRSRLFLSVLTVIGYMFADLAVTLYAGALMLHMVFPQVSIPMLVIGLAVLGASYTLIGGLSAVMRVELVQAFVLMGGSAILTWTAFDRAGGWAAVMNAAPAGHLSLIRPLNDPSVPWPTLLLSLPLLGFYFWGLSQTMVQRTLSARDVNHGRWGNLLAAGLNFVIFFLMVLPGVAGRVLYPNLQKGDEVYPKLVFEMLPPGLLGLVLIGFIAAMTSVLTSVLNSAQTLVTMDLIKKARPDLTEKQQVFAGSVAGIVIITVAALWAPHIREFDSIVKYFQQLMSYLCPPVVAVFLCGLFWKRATATGAFVGLMAGFLLAVSLMLGIKHTPLGGWNFLYVAPLIFLVSAAIIVGVSLLTDPPGESAVRRFVWNSSFYREETAELATVPWYQNFRILSLLLLAGTGLFVFLWR
ncbi:MAG: sodium transporter [Verrucomicrobia bacterium]|jgi:solute:Na+ symporter, SSS family|nr:sodium transporter [bacterium]NDA10112.1 sodium transporter [Verrucomicrobiota bacterium]NDD56919.1 sodium transporter [Verrucomicrobiota bacterium]